MGVGVSTDGTACFKWRRNGCICNVFSGNSFRVFATCPHISNLPPLPRVCRRPGARNRVGFRRRCYRRHHLTSRSFRFNYRSGRVCPVGPTIAYKNSVTRRTSPSLWLHWVRDRVSLKTTAGPGSVTCSYTSICVYVCVYTRYYCC